MKALPSTSSLVYGTIGCMSTCSLQPHHDDFSRHSSEETIHQGGDQETHYFSLLMYLEQMQIYIKHEWQIFNKQIFCTVKIWGKIFTRRTRVYFQPFILTLFFCFVPDVLQPFIQIHNIFQIYESGYEIRAVIVCISIFYPP